MLTITLPDSSKREFPQAVTVAEVAASIGAGLAKAALGGKVERHCLPVRRNVAVTDALLDSPRSVVLREAYNRMPAQMAVLHRLLAR